MVYSALWNIMLGIVGGIISSVIVSKVFLIQGEYQEQCKRMEHLLHKLYYIGGFYRTAKAGLEVSYDGELEKQHEMKEKGYRCEVEYYAAHKEKRWISLDDLLEKFMNEVHKIASSAHDELMTSSLSIKAFHPVVAKMERLFSQVSHLKEFTFSEINDFERNLDEITKEFDTIRKVSGKQIFSLIIHNKTMITLFVIVSLLAILTVVSGIIGF